jgi:hypothetical protein
VQDAPKNTQIDIVFNVFTEEFEVASKRYTIQNKWISLRKFFTDNVSAYIDLDLDLKTDEGKLAHARLNKLNNIKNYTYYINVLKDLSYEEVTDIFIRTNSGGTKLGNADLALARISSIRKSVIDNPNEETIVDKLGDYQDIFKKRSWGLKLDDGLLLRAVVVLLTGQSRFAWVLRQDKQGKQLTVDEIEAAWERVKIALDKTVSFLVQNCMIDHLEMLPTRNIIIPLIAFFDRNGNHMTSTEARELQRWVYMALIWTRYSTSSESAMDQDIAALSKDHPIQAMIQNIENEVGRRPVTEQELQDQRKNSPYMVMSYVLARQTKAQDWFNGIVIANDLQQQQYHIHHIFPKSKLGDKYDLRKDSRTVDQVANLAFLAAPTNKSISNRLPESYLLEIDEHRLHAQHIPMQHDLWKFDQFENFVRQRRVMLANAINQLLLSLSGDKHIWPSTSADILEIRVDALEKQLRKIVATRLTEVSGATAWEQLVSSDIRNRVSANIKKYEGNNPFTVDQHQALEDKLSFCLFSDLFKIIQNNLTHFDDIFGKETAQFTPNGQYVINVRNAFKHHQQVLDADLAHAEAGLLWFERCLAQVTEEDEDEEDKVSEAATA